MDRSELLQSYISGYADIIDALNELDKDSWNFIPGPGRWSIKEILIHLADSEINGYMRCRKIIAEPGSQIIPFDQDTWAEKLRYADQDIGLALDIFKLLRKNNYDLLTSLPGEVWANYIIHPEWGKTTLDDWLIVYEKHIRIHLNQIQNNFNLWLQRKE